VTRIPRWPALALLLLAAAWCAACASEAGAPEAPPSARPAAPGPSAAATIGAATPTPASAASVTLTAVGDVSLARELVPRMEQTGAGYPFALVAPLLSGDIVLANLEGALTDRGEPWPKSYNFRTPPRFADALRLGHVSVVSLANNHIMDYGAVGLADTIDALDADGIAHAGAGPNALGARLPAIVVANGLRVAVLGYVATPDEGGGFSVRQWASGVDVPGVAIGAPDAIAADVRAARAVADFVVVAVHAGDEYRRAPNATQRALAEAALAAGADAYIGAHAHVPQPVEQRGSQLIAWGLGNFVFDLDSVDLANIPEPRVSPVLTLTLTKGAGVTAYRVDAVTQDAGEDRPRPATPDEAAVLQALVAP
jgi:poly-gamma-glutamate capsule biosynthesis protein CapA/YwtB (metallophosphatase superfamily)